MRRKIRVSRRRRRCRFGPKHLLGLSRLWFSYPVERFADLKFVRAVEPQLYCRALLVPGFSPKRSKDGSTAHFCLPKSHKGWESMSLTSAARSGPVRATIYLDAYLTTKVPTRLRERTVTIRSEAHALRVAAQMYQRIYRHDERLGGEAADSDRARINRKARIARMKDRGGARMFLLNRGFGPYIWGHDLGDLVFEGMQTIFSNRRRCHIRFLIGS